MNPPPTDIELLNEWLVQHRESAFHLLVSRYAALVYATAKRGCGDDSLAAEASQLTFIALAQKAKSLTSYSTLGGWLHLTAVMQAKNLVRKSQREIRKRSLLQVTMNAETHHSSIDSWREMQPVLDDALASLSAKDREALILRFYRSLTVREIAATLGISIDAVHKRTDRATERLRTKLAHRGFLTSGSLSAAILAGYASEAQAMPLSIPLVASKAIAAAAVSSSSLLPSLLSLTLIMKSSSLIISPMIALIVVGGWAGNEYYSLSELEKESKHLETRLATHTSGSETDPSSITKSSGQTTPFKKLMAMYVEAQRTGSRSAKSRFEQQCKALSKEELISALAEVDGLNTSFGTSLELLLTLFKELCHKDPRSALDRIPKTSAGMEGWVINTLTAAMKEWSPKDLEMAEAWIKETAAAGKFDIPSLGIDSRLRSKMEYALQTAWMSVDPATAAVRLGALSPGARSSAFCNATSWGVREQDQLHIANLMRNLGPENGRIHLAIFAEDISINAVAERAIGIRDDADLNDLPGDFTAVTEFFDRIQATPEERAASVERCILEKANCSADRHITIAKIDNIRAWTLAQAPAVVNKVTSALLWHQAKHGSSFPQVAKLATKYCHQSGDDSLFVEFLSQEVPEGDKAEARLLAEKIADSERRQAVLNGLN